MLGTRGSGLGTRACGPSERPEGSPAKPGPRARSAWGGAPCALRKMLGSPSRAPSAPESRAPSHRAPSPEPVSVSRDESPILDDRFAAGGHCRVWKEHPRDETAADVPRQLGVIAEAQADNAGAVSVVRHHRVGRRTVSRGLKPRQNSRKFEAAGTLLSSAATPSGFVRALERTIRPRSISRRTPVASPSGKAWTAPPSCR